MPSVERLLRFYPRPWRERYREEFRETVGSGALHGQQVIDILAGAIDAWLSADVRRATRAERAALSEGGPTMRTMMACGRTEYRFKRRDALIAAGVILVATAVLSALSLAARRYGWPVMGSILTNLAFPGSMTLAMPFWLLKGQPWKAQAAIVGVTLAMLVAIGWITALT
jgi:hypothetical protein